MANDLVTKKSPHSIETTLDRLEQAARASGASILARIDHQAAAVAAGLPLRPTTVLIFGNARAGTPVMQERQTMGLDLPLRVLAWQDENKQVWLTFRDPAAVAHDHDLSATDAHLVALGAGLHKFIDKAIE